MAFKYQARSVETLEKRASQQGGDFDKFLKDEYKEYKPKKGENWVRILPPTWENPNHYGWDVWTHNRIGPGKAGVICLYKQFGRPCCLCDARSRAEAAHDEELTKELRPQRRVLTWVIDRKDEEKGPQLWPMPWTLDRDIAKISRDKRTGEIFLIDHPEEGYDVMFDKEGEMLTTKYIGIQISRRASSVDPVYFPYIEDNPLTETLLVRENAELWNIYTGGNEDAPPEPSTVKTNGSAPEKEVRQERSAPDREAPKSSGGWTPPAKTIERTPLKVVQSEPPPEDDAPPPDGHDGPDEEELQAMDEARAAAERAAEPTKTGTVARRQLPPENAPVASTTQVSDSGKTRAQLLREKFAKKA